VLAPVPIGSPPPAAFWLVKLSALLGVGGSALRPRNEGNLRYACPVFVVSVGYSTHTSPEGGLVRSFSIALIAIRAGAKCRGFAH